MEQLILFIIFFTFFVIIPLITLYANKKNWIKPTQAELEFFRLNEKININNEDPEEVKRELKRKYNLSNIDAALIVSIVKGKDPDISVEQINKIIYGKK